MSNTSKKPSALAQAWLIVYNVAMSAGWFIIGLGIVDHYLKHETYKGLYRQVEKQLLFFQSLAVLEIFHSMFGVVRSSVMVTTMQVFSRVGILWAVLQPIVQVQDKIGFTMLLVAWTITEIIRYLFYTCQLLGFTPRILLWLRYTLFIVLYPLGVTGELLTVYHSLKPVKEEDLFSLHLPNTLNFAFDYYTVLIGMFPVYLIFFPQLYCHMFAQRKKQLGYENGSAKKLN